ncbi:MAG: tetratricopeptide repeat protein [Bacteroidetes bacterium]|nr:tetratricopeptide repeat protein [Bacteroidota bacterium]
MKNTLILLLFFIIPLTHVLSQPAGQEVNFSVIDKVQSTLDNVIGWSIQDNGKWASAKNSIPFPNSQTNKRPTAREKLGIENFKQLQLKKVLIDNIQYNVLILIYEDGDYEFPTLQEGWVSFESVEFFVFMAENMVKILPHDIPYNKPYAVNMEVFCAGCFTNYNPENLDDKIVAKIQATQNKTSYNSANLVFAVKVLQEKRKKSVNFNLIRSFSEESLSAYYLDTTSVNRLFDLSYYKAKYDQFKQFIRDSEVHNIPTATATPNDSTGHYNWGVLKYQAGNYDGAIEDFDKALEEESNSTHSMLYSYRGITQIKMGNYNAAIESFDKAIDLEPTNVMLYSNWIKNYYNRGVSHFYVNDLEGACSDWEKAFELGLGTALENLRKYCK